MSGKVSGEVWGPALTRAQREILLALADHANDTGGSVRPSVKLIAWKTDYSQRYVRKILKQLRQMAIVEQVRFPNGGRGHATEYQIHLDKAPRKKEYTRSPIHEIKSDLQDTQASDNGEGRDTVYPERVSARLIMDDLASSPQTSIESQDSNKMHARWLEILREDSRWPSGDMQEFVRDVEASYADLDLTSEAHKYYEWLQSSRGLRRSQIKRVWLNWLGNARKYQAQEPSVDHLTTAGAASTGRKIHGRKTDATPYGDVSEYEKTALSLDGRRSVTE